MANIFGANSRARVTRSRAIGWNPRKSGQDMLLNVEGPGVEGELRVNLVHHVSVEGTEGDGRWDDHCGARWRAYLVASDRYPEDMAGKNKRKKFAKW